MYFHKFHTNPVHTSNSDSGDGAAINMALQYDFFPKAWGECEGTRFQLEPYIALNVNDNKAAEQDSKGGQIGFTGLLGCYGPMKNDPNPSPSYYAWIFKGYAKYDQNKIDDTKSVSANLKSQLVWNKLNSHPYFIRPSASVYYLNTVETKDATKAPKGNLAGISANLEIDYYPISSNRFKTTYSGSYSQDIAAGGDRNKDNYYMNKAGLQYYLYDPEKDDYIGNKYSIGVEYSNGRDKFSTSPHREETVAIYLGVLF